jgi:hypothetical protein
MNSKKAITLLVLVTLLLSMVPMTFGAVGITALSEVTGDYGNTVEVTGDGVPAGTIVEIFWDDTTIAWNGVRGKLNQTTADGDGTYEIWFDVPEAVAGVHNVWVKAGSDYDSAAYTVVPRVKTASSSGLSGDKVSTDVYGQAKEKDIALVMASTQGVFTWNWVAAPQVQVPLDAGETEYDGNLAGLVGPTFVVITDGVETFTDDGSGVLTGDQGGSGKINYVTGEWEVEYNTAPVALTTVDYVVFTPLLNTAYELSTSGETDIVGSYTKQITIPVAADGSYWIASLDAKGNVGTDDFEIGAVITVSDDEVAVGDVVTVSGRGFTPFGAIIYANGVTVGGLPAVIDDYDGGVDIDNDGEFSFKLVIPQMDDEDDYDISVSDGVKPAATVEVEVTDLAEITVTPDYGPQGQTVTITGMNFPNIKDEDLAIELEIGGTWIKDIETDSDGTFSETFRIPAVVDGNYEINVYWNDPAGRTRTIQAQDDFRIGSILVLLSDNEGPAGLQVIMSGNGFTPDEGWNATFGDIDIFEDMVVDNNGLLGVPMFYVPQVEPGTYDITVLDEDTEIAVTVEFTVTDATSFEVIPSEAPAGYNITFEGMYWSEDQVPTFEFVVFNDTDEWDITDEVYERDGGGGDINPFMTGDTDGSNTDDGAFIAYWHIGDEDPSDATDVFSVGTYWLNVTYGDDFFYQTSFVVGEPYSNIGPRKSVFRIGDTLTFNIEHSFGNNPASDIAGGMVDIMDPEGNLYFRTNNLAAGVWVKSGMYYYVPISSQTANANPMILLDDAPLGEWSYEWYENDGETIISEGTFMVEASTDDIVSGKIDDLNNQITDLQDTVSGVTGEFDDLQSSIADVSALARDAVSAANAAADAVTAVAATANTASEAAADAAEAANAARDAASGLTTLVYGAIGAALVAALAAIVSLMQISRRIAG